MKKPGREDIERLIQNGRGTTFEWLEDTSPVSYIAESLSAMANSQGGTLLIGVRGEDTPIVKGIDDQATAIDRLVDIALSLDPPLIAPLPFSVELEGKTVVVVPIPAGMPHVFALNGRYLFRRGTQNVALASQDLRRLFIARGEISFETNVAYGALLSDLDWDKVHDYVKSLHGLGDSDPRHVLLRRGCLIRQDGDFFPTNAGVLLFGRDPQQFVLGADITAVRFAGENMSDTFSRQDITGTLPDQIKRAETFLIDHLRKGVQLRHTMARKEQFEYPMEAARELVVNAVAHRDYSISGDGIRLFLFKDRMEVTSPGGLAGPVTIDNIKDERFSRNPAVVQVLSDMGYIERLGYGVDRVIELMHQQNLGEPDFCETSGGFRVTLHNRAEKAPHQVTAEIVSGEYDGIVINPRQEAALSYLKQPNNSRITNSELQRLYPDVHAETIRRDLADLVTKNILTKRGQKRGSYYVLKKDTEDH